jgi:hypothetical protein
MTPTLIFEWLGCITGVIGSALLASNTTMSRWGFCWYLASNACWVAFAVSTAAWGLLTMQIVFTAVSIFGVFRWFVRRPTRLIDTAPSVRTRPDPSQPPRTPRVPAC